MQVLEHGLKWTRGGVYFFYLLLHRVLKFFVILGFFPQGRVTLEKVYSTKARQVFWFHASSVGELESLVPLIFLTAERGVALVVSVFSASAKSALEKLKRELEENSFCISYMGYSPWEGEWEEAFSRLNPDCFLTAKYEAWPDLWISLKKKGIPLAMVSVQKRKSLKIAKFFSCFFGGLPEMLLFPCDEEKAESLKKFFPEATLEVCGEPRWDRVALKKVQKRSQSLRELYARCKRPWGILGSVWIEDLEFLRPIFEEKSLGSLWVVPHSLKPKNIQAIASFLKEVGWDVSTSSHPIKKDPSCILVDEFGLLADLYAFCDWSFVGGGLGPGVHSTIEPAIHGIPIGVGPRGTQKFSEVFHLQEVGQLSILKNQKDLKIWLSKLVEARQYQASWKQHALSRLGASQKIDFFLQGFFSGRS
jgi:3-deoxy-D-manno-octulosonic-acid transferase